MPRHRWMCQSCGSALDLDARGFLSCPLGHGSLIDPDDGREITDGTDEDIDACDYSEESV